MSMVIRWIVSALLLTFGCASAGCLSEQVARTAFPDAIQAPISLRVTHCYVNPEGQLVVAGEGGVYQENPADTPRAPIWFKADLPALAKVAKGKMAVLPQAVVQRGEPGAAWLEKEHFSELPFAEYAYNSETPLNANNAPSPSEPSVKIVYWDTFVTKHFPDRLGHGPEISVRNDPAMPPVRIAVMDVKRQTDYGLLVLLPAAAAGDAMAAGGRVAGIDPGFTMLVIGESRIDHNLKEDNRWPWRPWR